MRRTTGPWLPDVMAGFEATRLGRATLVRAVAQPRRPIAAVLHVHGYNDYFFQAHLARAFLGADIAFYALDLPGAGRSLRDGDIPHYMTDAADQGDHIAEAMWAMSTLHPGVPLALHAHSTGGLTGAIWAADRPHPGLAAVILDSPLLGIIAGGLQRRLAGAAPIVASFWPTTVVAQAPSLYAQYLHVSNGGRWDFNLEWKRTAGVPIRAGWLSAVQRAQRRVADGLGIECPVLVARSAASGPEDPTCETFDEQDVIVDVTAIERLAPRLGEHVTELVVPGGVHELSLSADAPRTFYLESIIAWLVEEAS